MANLTIRNLDDGTVDILKTRAKTHNRSLESELIPRSTGRRRLRRRQMIR